MAACLRRCGQGAAKAVAGTGPMLATHRNNQLMTRNGVECLKKLERCHRHCLKPVSHGRCAPSAAGSAGFGPLPQHVLLLERRRL